MQKTSRRVLALVLALVMALSVFGISASAANTNYRADYQSETHTVFKHTEETLAPGVEYYNNYAYSSEGKQMVYYVTTADINRDDVICQISYKDMQCENLGMSKLTEQVAAANAKYSDPENESLTDYEREHYANENYVVVSATNGNGYNMSTGKPSGAWAMGGTVAQDMGNLGFLAILKDGKAVVGRTMDEWNSYKEQGIAEAINAFGSILVWDGEDVTNKSATARASRTMIGVTEDGKVVTAVLDGRQEPFSCGGSYHELAQIMLEAGCKYAINLDGGGSTTFVKRSPGEEEAKIVNRPSDGSERSISNGIIIASKAKVKDEVASVTFSAENDYVTPGTSTKVSAIAYDEDSAPITNPKGLTYDVVGGTYENGIFTASNATTDATITAMYNGKEVGSATIHVVYPDAITFNEFEAFYERLGTSTPISFSATYNNGEVKTKPEDFELTVTNTTAAYEGEIAGSFDGLIYNAPADTAGNRARYKTGTLTAKVKGTDVQATNAVKFTDTYVLAQGFETSGRYADPEEMYKSTVNTDLVTSEYVTAETGKVHSGNRSLAINVDFTGAKDTPNYATGYQAVSQRLNTMNESYGKTFGMWIYIPERIDSLRVRCYYGTGYPIAELIDTGKLHREKYDEGAWHYFAADISGVENFSVAYFDIYVSDRDGEDDGYYFKDATNVNKKFTLYIDDIGYDRTYGGYDMQDPVFGDVIAYTAFGQPGTELEYQQVPDINASKVTISADVDDDRETNPYTVSGLDYSTAKAFIDGVEVDAEASDNKITVEDAALGKGVHSARFEIKDNEGNIAIINRYFNITAGADSALKLVSRTPIDTKVLIGSVHWFDLVADDPAAIDSADVTLDLDSFSNWQYKRIVTADGFTHTATVDDKTNTLTLHVEKTGTVGDNNVIASVPVKVWETVKDAEYLFTNKVFWPTAIEINSEKGVVALADGSSDTFSFAPIKIDSEIDGNYAKLLEEGYFEDGKTSWHQHTLEWIEEPTDATCTELGSHGTARCSVCNEIVYYDEPVYGAHHYEWNIEKQKYVCKDCDHETDEKPTIERFGTVGSFSDGVVENGWVITEGEEENIFYLQDGAKLKTATELPMYDGSGTYMLGFNSTSPFHFTGLFTGAINIANYKCKVYENGVLSTGEGDHLVTNGASIWIVNKDGETAYEGTTTGFYECNGLTYCVKYGKTTASQSVLNGGLWTGPLNYNSNTSATTDNYYIRGVKMEGWTCKKGAAYDAEGNLVTGWRNADGTPADVNLNDESSLIGKYCFGTDGKVKIGNAAAVINDNMMDNRYCSFGTKTGVLDNIGECEGFYKDTFYSGTNTDMVMYENGFPVTNTFLRPSGSTYTFMYINGVRQVTDTSTPSPKLFADGYYYNLNKQGYVFSQYDLTSRYFGTSEYYNRGMDPYWIEGRYTGVIDDGDNQGYAIFGKLYEGYTLTDDKVCDANGAPINQWFINGFGDNVYYKDGAMVANGQFVADGKLYRVTNEYGKAVPVNGIQDNVFYIDGVAKDAVYADKYVVSDDGKVCTVNEDGSIGNPVNGIIGETYFIDGVAQENQVFDGKCIKDGDMVKEVADDGTLKPFNGILGDTYYENGTATDYAVVAGKYVFKDDILYTLGSNGTLGTRFSGSVEGVTYASGKPQNGWVADKYYYENGQKVTGRNSIDGVYYEFDADGAMISKFNGMLYDEDADVYRVYDQGVRKNGVDEFGSCIDGIPANGWYANEYYFIDGKYLTGVKEVDGFYYDFGEDGSSSPYKKYTGMFDKDGYKYYAVLGKLASGWITVGEDYYYFNPADNRAVDGTRKVNGIIYKFVDYVLTEGSWLEPKPGEWLYMWAGRGHIAGWDTIDGKTYLFNGNGYAYTGIKTTPHFDRVSGEKDFVFDERGAWMSDYTGLYDIGANTYYVQNGFSVGGGLRLIDGKYYYFKSNKTAVKDTAYFISITNDLMPAGKYNFDADGAMIVDTPVEPQPEKNGIIEENGALYYYINGIKQDCGLFEYEGKYYYSRTGGVLARNCSYFISRTNDLMPAGKYNFDADGAMIADTPVEPQPEKNGIIEENGALYYYINGIKQDCGLFEYEGKYYYSRTGGVLARNCSYFISRTNDLMPAGKYNFDADGAMIADTPVEPQPDKNGLIEENGAMYYYINGVKQDIGLFEYEGKYYYSRTGGALVKDCTYFISRTNNLMPAGKYVFDANGVMQVG